MEAIVLYTNNQGVELDLSNLDQAKQSLQEIKEFLIFMGVDPTPLNIKGATKKVFLAPVEKFKQTESDKIKKIIASFGDTLLTKGWEGKVNQQTAEFQNSLSNDCPDFEFHDLLKYFTFENEIEVNPKFDTQYFIDKNSTTLSDPEQLDFYEKHCQALELLNELTQHPDNEFVALDKLFFFNSETKEFELNIKQYHDVLADRVAEEKRIKGEEYNRSMRLKYENNQRIIEANRGTLNGDSIS